MSEFVNLPLAGGGTLSVCPWAVKAIEESGHGVCKVSGFGIETGRLVKLFREDVVRLLTEARQGERAVPGTAPSAGPSLPELAASGWAR